MITDNPKFKEWFGSSKVVDKEGKPLICYHGSSRSGFTSFKSNIDDSYRSDIGIHFGTAAQAEDRIYLSPTQLEYSYEEYLETLADDEEPLDYEDFVSSGLGIKYANYHTEGKGDYGNHAIYPVYLKIENPLFTLDIVEHGNSESIIEDAIEGRVGESLNSNIHGITKEQFKKLINHFRKPDEYGTPNPPLKDLQQYLMSIGYDGLCYYNDFEDQGAYGLSWCVFNPNQIKSALGNKGSFDAASSDITEGAALMHMLLKRK